MSLTLERPALEQHGAESPARLTVVDTDIHPSFKTGRDLDPFLSARWREHQATYGTHLRQGLANTLAHPRMYPAVARADSWPPNGAPPGSDLDFMRTHHLDAHNIEFGLLMCLRPGAGDERNLDFAAALAAAANDWQVAAWCEPEPRLRGCVVIPQEDPDAAVREIERCARDNRFVQVNMPPRTSEPLGRRRYWPIYRAAAAAGLPIGLHISGVPGHPSTSAGWPSFYIQEHHANSQCLQSVVTSMVMEGVFEHVPDLKVVIIEAGFGWAPSLCWRMDKHWAHMRSEVPHVRRPPSEYVREHFWYTTQPVEEPERPRDLGVLIDWVGEDRIMFSTDYPHWDFDDPRWAFKSPMTEARKAAIFSANAKRLYKL